jgi:hypothetical protein
MSWKFSLPLARMKMLSLSALALKSPKEIAIW